MLKTLVYIGLLFFAFSEGHAQKIMEKSWDASSVERLEVISDEVYHIIITSEPTERVSVRAKVEGEHSENVALLISEENKTLSISSGFTPFFVKQNDKLAAHKVISIEMEIRVPQDMKVLVKGAIVSVETKGTFKEILLDLRNGNCVLTHFKGNAQLTSRNGDITVFARQTGARIVDSRNGHIKNELPDKGQFLITAESVNGDITLLKSQK
ncbi:MAG: DUF4097 family beta strand repeat-containing protein [Bacteroidota bacterium]